MTTKRVVVGFDDSDEGHRAMVWALRYAQEAGLAVEVVTAYRKEAAPWGWVAGPVDERAWAAKEQDKAVTQVLNGMADKPVVRCTVAEGDPVDVLCAAAVDADLLILGSHGRGHVATALLGSVSADCIHRATTPVLVVPAHKAAPRSNTVEPMIAATL